MLRLQLLHSTHGRMQESAKTRKRKIEVKYLEPETVEIQFNGYIVIRLTLDEVDELISKLKEAI